VLIAIHPENPQPRLIKQLAQIITKGGLVILQTDTFFSFACCISQKKTIARLCQLRALKPKHNFTMLCHSITQIAEFANVSNDAFRVIKTMAPGPFTFLLKATRKVPKLLQQKSKKTIGVRIANSQYINQLLYQLDLPIFCSTVKVNDAINPTNGHLLSEWYAKQVDAIVTYSALQYTETTILDMTEQPYLVVRQGVGAY